jgi:hypothetical protein
MRMRVVIVTVMSLLMLAGSALAVVKQAEAVKLDGLPKIKTADEAHLAKRSDTTWGNTNAPAWLITDWVYGAEKYKYLLGRPGEGDPCSRGFWVENVHMLLNFDAEDVPSTFSVFVGLADALFDPASGCYTPGWHVCTSLTYEITIEEPGTYDVSIPLYEQCDCADLNYRFLLSWHFVTEFDPARRPDAVADDAPIGCYSWNNYGTGWQDLVLDEGWPGEIIMWADIFCCDDPVGTDPTTWGGVKSLYR